MPNRRMFRVPADVLQGDDKYKFNNNVDQWETSAVSEATLLSSELFTGAPNQHAPLLDIDIPAAVIPAPTGTQLWLDAKMGRFAYRNLLRTLKDLGLCSADRPELSFTRSGTTRKARLAAYAAVQDQATSWASTAETCGVLCGDSNGPFEPMLEAAVAVVPPETHPGPGMRRPWVVPLDVPVFNPPSSRPGHSHLYLDAVLNWEQYIRLLDVLAKAKIIEPGYRSASIARQMTCVRRPGVKKLTDEELVEARKALW